MSFREWQQRHPMAAIELETFFAGQPWEASDVRDPRPEAEVQARIRKEIASRGAMSWRNNVGATRAKTDHRCPQCNFRFYEHQQPVRYGLANDSMKLNRTIKSSDLILAIPRVIRPEHVGTTIAQFGSIECKAEGWTGPKDDHERAQAAWLTLITRLGGYAKFSTGAVNL